MDLVSAKYLLATPKYAMVLLYSRTWEFGAIGVPPFIPSHSTCGAHQHTTHILYYYLKKRRVGFYGPQVIQLLPFHIFFLSPMDINTDFLNSFGMSKYVNGMNTSYFDSPFSGSKHIMLSVQKVIL